MPDSLVTNETRPATDDEITKLALKKESNFVSIAFALFVLALLNGVVGAFLTFSLVLMLGPEAAAWIKWIVPLTAIALTVVVVRARSIKQRQIRQQVDDDIANHEIAIVRGRNVDWYYSLAARNKSSFVLKREFPVLVGDLGDGDRLILTGESMFAPEIYGYEPSALDFQATNRAINGLPQPFEFPTRDFVVEYWPCSGFLNSIVPAGEPVDPVSIYIDSLHRVGWSGQEVVRCDGDPGLICVAESRPIVLSATA